MAESSSCWVCDYDSVKRVTDGVVDITVTGVYGTHISTVNKDTCWVYDGLYTGYTYLIQNGVIARTITDLGGIGTLSFSGISAVDETCFWIGTSGTTSYVKRYKVGETTISVPIQTGAQNVSVSAIDADSCFACSVNTPRFYKINTSGIVYTLTGFTGPTSVSAVDADTCWVTDPADATYPNKRVSGGAISHTLGGSTDNKVSKIDADSCFVSGVYKMVSKRTLTTFTTQKTFSYNLIGLDTINDTDFWCVVANNGSGNPQLIKYSNKIAKVIINLAFTGDSTEGRSRVSTIFLDDNPNQAFGGGQ